MTTNHDLDLQDYTASVPLHLPNIRKTNIKSSYTITKMSTSSDIDSIPTPDHCTADFCLIPVPPSQNPSACTLNRQHIHTEELTYVPCKYIDRNSLRLRISTDRRRATPNRKVGVEVCHAFCWDDLRCFPHSPLLQSLICFCTDGVGGFGRRTVG